MDIEFKCDDYSFLVRTSALIFNKDMNNILFNGKDVY